MNNSEMYNIGDRVIGCKGTNVEGLIGTVIAMSDVEDKIFVSFIPPIEEETRSKVHIMLNIENNKSTAVSLAIGISVKRDEIIRVQYYLDTAKKKYNKYKIRYGFEHNPKKKASLEEKIHTINNSIKELSNAIMYTGYFDYSKYDLSKIIKED